MVGVQIRIVLGLGLKWNYNQVNIKNGVRFGSLLFLLAT